MKRENKQNRFYHFLCQHDVYLRIYSSFALVLIVMLVLTGLIFIRLYQKNYVASYTELLTKQGKKISKRVAKFYANDNVTQYEKYCVYLDELEKAEKTDVWIVSNEDAAAPLAEEYTNADLEEDSLTGEYSEDAQKEDPSIKEMKRVLEEAFQGEVASSAGYDNVYGMVALRVAVPIYAKDTEQVIGGVLMVSMMDRQTMGLDEGKYLITVSAFTAVVFSFLLAIFMTRYLSISLNKINRDIERMAQGDYSEIVTYSRSRQLAVTEEQLNKLSTQLARVESERANLEQVRQDFFANVSHELRTPITVIRGYAESLNDGVITDPKSVSGLYQRMLAECKGMERLVEDLFVLSKMQNPDFQIVKEPVSLRQIFVDLQRSSSVIGEDKQIDLIMELPEEDPCMVFGDYGRLRQMFMIIIDNAIKFSDIYGKIWIRLEKKDGRLDISIQDQGVGIEEEKLPYIFEKFYKSKMRQNDKGTGLGLMIARQIALRHDGDIQVESTVGEGTTFYFSFAELTAMEEYE